MKSIAQGLEALSQSSSGAPDMEVLHLLVQVPLPPPARNCDEAITYIDKSFDDRDLPLGRRLMYLEGALSHMGGRLGQKACLKCTGHYQDRHRQSMN